MFFASHNLQAHREYLGRDAHLVPQYLNESMMDSRVWQSPEFTPVFQRVGSDEVIHKVLTVLTDRTLNSESIDPKLELRDLR